MTFLIWVHTHKHIAPHFTYTAVLHSLRGLNWKTSFTELLHEDSWLSGIKVSVSGWNPAATFSCPVSQSLQCVLALAPCLFAFILCMYGFTIMTCHLSVKAELVNYPPWACVFVRMYFMCVWHQREWQLGLGVTLQAFFLSLIVHSSPGWQGLRCGRHLQKYKFIFFLDVIQTENRQGDDESGT